MCEKKKFYITTAIAYTSRKPHIGNAYDIVLADMIARYKKMMGFDVYLMTGSDEHGQKIEQCANEAGITPKEYVDKISSEIKSVWNSMNTEYDKFIRTTDEQHEKTVQKIFKKLYDQGDIYKGTYEGKYCVPCESFFTASQLVDGKCPDCGRDVIDSKEEAYFLKLSKYQDKLVEYYEQNPDFIKPESRKNEMINNFIKPGLADLCVSRSTFKWGIPVTFDDRHVIYVWIDALSNYITGIGYDTENSSDTYKKLWPADLHVIGKDIVRFHTIYWPIILMALGEPLPKQVLGHPWVLVGEDKMSKSKGNVIYADELANRFSSDAVRYYLLSEIPYTQDGTITYESFITKFNSDLANTLGNLVNRCIAMTNKYFGGKVTKPVLFNDLDKELISFANDTKVKYYSFMDSYHNADACEAVMNFAKRCNKYIDETAPWTLAKDENSLPRLSAVLYNLLECIRLLGIMLSPVIPNSSKSITEQLNNSDYTLNFGETKEYNVGEATPLFARIDAEKVLAEIKAENEAKSKENSKNVTTLSQISIEDFAKVELLTAKITKCEPIPKAKKLLKLTLDDGSGKERIVASGIAKWYTPDDLIGHNVIVVSNLKPAVLCGAESNGMILAADCSDDLVKVIFTDDIPVGSKIR
ncbi:MAG: methionine--tRNA ligase [Clostridia bacterium]|nr:methionine--tRNA ligase [Clostridia bacterium]